MISFLLDWTNVKAPRISSYTPRVIVVRKKIRRKDATIFDNKVTPWKLLQEGISLNTLNHWKAKLPILYIDLHGNIRRSKDYKLIMMGPNWSDKKEMNRQEDPPF